MNRVKLGDVSLATINPAETKWRRMIRKYLWQMMVVQEHIYPVILRNDSDEACLRKQESPYVGRSFASAQDDTLKSSAMTLNQYEY